MRGERKRIIQIIKVQIILQVLQYLLVMGQIKMPALKLQAVSHNTHLFHTLSFREERGKGKRILSFKAIVFSLYFSLILEEGGSIFLSIRGTRSVPLLRSITLNLERADTFIILWGRTSSSLQS